MKVLVTGSSGLVGRFLADELACAHAVTLLDVRPPHRSDLPYLEIDLLKAPDAKKNIREFDAVVHLAGVPHPLERPPEEVFQVNTLGTLNVLEACAANNIGRFILMSSESTLGFAFSGERMWPQFVPIDESHPTRPQDAYGLSKLTAELLCRGYTRRTGIRTICLRPPWIWVPDAVEVVRYRELVRDYEKWSKNLWGFVHVHDLSAAVEGALHFEGEELHEVFFITAAENWTGVSSRKLLERFYPETQQIRGDFEGAASFISSMKARRLLGYQPVRTAADLVGRQQAAMFDSK